MNINSFLLSQVHHFTVVLFIHSHPSVLSSSMNHNVVTDFTIHMESMTEKVNIIMKKNQEKLHCSNHFPIIIPITYSSDCS
jgi:hypothetical protein